MTKKLLQWIAVLSVLGLLAGACSNNKSGTSTSPNNSNNSLPNQSGLFPQSVVNQPVHTGTPKKGGSLTFGVESEILDVSPNQNVIQPSDVEMANAVFDPLLSYGTKGKDKGVPVLDNSNHYYNQLADKLTSSNNLRTWTLTLRKGVKFSDGTPLTAADVVDHTKWAMGFDELFL